MGRDLRAAAARTGEDFDDATVVDFGARERARTDFASLHDCETVARPLSFDDMPTKVWTPRPPAAGRLPSRVSIRRLRSVEAEPSVQVETEPRIDVEVEPSVQVQIEPPPPAWRDEVTRIEVLRQVRPTEETTSPGVAKASKAGRNPVSAVRIACVVVAALILAGYGVAWHRRLPSTHALPPPTAVRANVPAPSLSAPPARVVPAPHSSPAPPPALAPPITEAAPAAMSEIATAPATEEYAAVEAVQSGDVRRAARLYSALAASHPNNEAYREAARILLEGTKESHP